MLANLDRLEHYRSRVASLHANTLTLEDDQCFETDVLLWATGFRMNLEYLDLPEYRDIDRLEELAPRLGSLVRSADHEGLFFVGMSLAESTSATPFFAAVESRSIVAHMLGRCEVPTANVPHHIAHWRLFQHFANFDRSNYPLWWRPWYLLLACWYALFPNKTVHI